MTTTKLDSYLWIVFSTFLRVVAVAGVVIAAASTPQDIEVPRDIARDMVDEFIREKNITSLNSKSEKSNFNRENQEDTPTNNKRQRVKYDHERARLCVQDDWMGPVPRFSDKSFERTFRITRSMVETLVTHLAKRDSFWRRTVCRAGKPTICPYAKFLMGMKMICYGVSGNAFVDYFQMGESTTRRCVSLLTKGIVSCRPLANQYLRRLSKIDARNIVSLHERVHKIPGMMGSLDVTKVHWKKCPSAWKGQFQGREKIASIGLEAVVDTNLWFWHAAFGYPGTLNDINVWEPSLLYESMIDGRHEELDFEYMVDGEVFVKLLYLVDGIYPPLTRFLSSESDPHTKLAYSYARDQEAFRKDVERGFGVLKLKFLSLLHPINLHHKDDIYYLVLACILMHNMMVEARVENNEEESAYLYNTLMATEGQSSSGETPDDSEEMEALVTEVQEDVMDRNIKHEIVMRRWASLYDRDGAQKLKKAMMRHLYRVKHGDAALESSEQICDEYNPLNY
jgi:hypothetical protein